MNIDCSPFMSYSKNMITINNPLIKLNLFLLVVLFGFLAYLRFWPVYIPEYFNQPFPVTGDIRAGGKVRYIVDYCKDIMYWAQISRFIVPESGSDVQVSMDGQSILSATKKGCNKSNPSQGTIPFTIPDILWPWKYYLRIDLIFNPNFVREVPKTYRTATFTIK